MRERRKLVLRKESLTELTGDALHDVVGGATLVTFCQCTYSLVNCTSGFECPSLPSCVVGTC